MGLTSVVIKHVKNGWQNVCDPEQTRVLECYQTIPPCEGVATPDYSGGGFDRCAFDAHKGAHVKAP